MHQLAIAFKDLGLNVLGYDLKSNDYTQLCAKKGINITHKFNKDFLNVDICVKTGAIKENKFIKSLKDLNVPIVDRAEILGWLATKFKTVIAVCGTHGKSTTASLIYEILRVSGQKVSCHIGAEVFAPRFVLGDDFLVVEACEYNKSFLKIHPNIVAVTNIEPEHLESYGSFFNLKNAFATFIKRANVKFVMCEKSTEFLSRYKNIQYVEVDEKLESKLKGEHNQKNLSLAVRVAKHLEVEEKYINQVVASFKGVPRRYECLGRCGKTKIYVDYAHHPTEVNAFISTFQNEYKNALIIFQPHTYSRTKNFFGEFVSVLSKTKNLVIYKEYPARENRSQGKTALELFKDLEARDINVTYACSPKQIERKLTDFSAVAFVGAGDINKVAEKFVDKNFKHNY